MHKNTKIHFKRSLAVLGAAAILASATALPVAAASSDVLTQLAGCSPCKAKKGCNPCAAKGCNPCAAKKKKW